MPHNSRAGTAIRRWRALGTLVAAVIAVLAVATAAGCQPLAGSSSAAGSAVDLRDTLQPPDAALPGAPPLGASGREGRVALGQADGAVPDDTTVFDDEVPGVARLDPDLLRALRRAAADAAGRGITVFVDSGWRSRAYQERLFRAAVSKYGSEQKASRWVATPDTSAHVSGEAVDVGHAEATAWLAKHGARYGLCQIYRNEPWHYELREEARDRGCPAMYVDPTHDPRLHP